MKCTCFTCIIIIVPVYQSLFRSEEHSQKKRVVAGKQAMPIKGLKFDVKDRCENIYMCLMINALLKSSVVLLVKPLKVEMIKMTLTMFSSK